MMKAFRQLFLPELFVSGSAVLLAVAAAAAMCPPSFFLGQRCFLTGIGVVASSEFHS